MYDKINTQCVAGMCYSDHMITQDDIKLAVRKIKLNKTDGTCKLVTNHLSNGTDLLFSHISSLFTMMMNHGCCPVQFSTSTIIPIVKNKRKSASDISNYRSIAICNVLGKLFDYVILEQHQERLTSSELQFGFKTGSSTTACTFVLEEVTRYYNTNGSDVYVMLLDASKAFDRVHYIKLFNLLLDRGLCPLLCRILLHMYSSQTMRVKWGNAFSCNFDINNGVKQGGVLSPTLFNIYLDGLLNNLSNSGFGAIAYADDIALMSPSRQSLEKMLDICSVFSSDYNLLFNADKSQLIVYPHRTKDDIKVHIRYCGRTINSANTGVHLGHIIGPSDHSKRTAEVISDFNRRVNVFLSIFGFARVPVKYSLFKTYCMSLYSALLCDYSSKPIKSIFTAWRKAV